MPQSNSKPLPVSTSEWMPSDSMAELLLKEAAKNLVRAMARFPAIAVQITSLDPLDAMLFSPAAAWTFSSSVRSSFFSTRQDQ